MNAECYCNFQSNFNVGSREPCFVTIGEDTSRQVAQVELRNFIGYLQYCLQRINVYFVSILVLFYRIRSFFHLILFSYFIDFVSFRYILFSYFTDFVVSFRWISFSYYTDFVSFRWISLSYFTDFVGFCFRFVSFRFFSFLSLPVPQYLCLLTYFPWFTSSVCEYKARYIYKYRLSVVCLAVYPVPWRQSEGSLVRRSISPTVRQSEGPLVRRFVSPKVRQSEGMLVRRFVCRNVGHPYV